MRAQAEAIGGQYQQLLTLPDEDARAKAYPAAIQALVGQGYLKEGEAPAEYPGMQALQFHIAPLLGAQKIIENERAAAAEKRAGETHAVDLTKKRTELAAQILGAARSPGEWSLGLQLLPEEMRANYPSEYSPEAAAQVAARGMTPAERAAAERAAAERAGWQTMRSTDEDGNVWEWYVNPATRESTQPVNKGKIGGSAAGASEDRVVQERERKTQVEQWAGQFLNQAEGDMEEAKALLEEAARAEGFVRDNRLAIQRALTSVEKGGGDSFLGVPVTKTNTPRGGSAPRGTANTAHAAAAGKTTTMAKVRQFALAKGITVAEARRQVEAEGYTIAE